MPNALRKKIAAIVTEKLQTYAQNNKISTLKQTFSSTYVPFYDRLMESPKKKGASIAKAEQNCIFYHFTKNLSKTIKCKQTKNLIVAKIRNFNK